MTSKTFLLILVFCTLCGFVAAQPVMAGLKLGAPITDAFNISKDPTLAAFSADSGNFLWGPYVEFKLPFKFSIEADALHRGYTFSQLGTVTHSSSWQVPIVAKYHFLKGPIKPYAEGGISFAHVSDIPQFVNNHNTNFGVVLGAGVQVNLLVLRISPEIRWTGDTVKNFSGVIDSNRNQVAFLVGIGF